MSFLSFFSGDKVDPTLSLLVDVGSSSVGVALGKIEKGKPILIIESVREDIPFQDELSSSRFLIAMNRALTYGLKKIHEKSKGVPAHIFCTLSSPWVILKTRSVPVSKEHDFQVTERMLEDFLHEDIEKLKEELKTSITSKEIEVIEKKITQIKLNGYEIKNPIGQTTKNVKIMASLSLSSKRVLTALERTIGQFFHTSTLRFGSFQVATFSAIRDIFGAEQNFLFLDITGESTDVSFVSNDILVQSTSFPRGKNFFIREISSELRTVHAEASTLFDMFLSNNLKGDSKDRIAGIVNRAKKQWIGFFEKSLVFVAESGLLPKKVFFTADQNIAELFTEFITISTSDLMIGGTFEARYLDQTVLAPSMSFESGVTRDPFIAINALFTKKTLDQEKK